MKDSGLVFSLKSEEKFSKYCLVRNKKYSVELDNKKKERSDN